MKTDLFDFEVPEELIAQSPLENRSDSRLLVYYRKKDLIIDSFTKDISSFLNNDYFLVFNNSKVIPARLKIIKKENSRDGEILILKIIDDFTIEVITDKSKKYKLSTEIILPDGSICFVEKDIDQFVKIIKSKTPIFTLNYLEKYGSVPLPPYIKGGNADNYDKERYQTIYSQYYGSAAAPTAGLHFDQNIFSSLDNKQISYSFVCLNVGLGTFQPIYTNNIEEHKIHTEEYFIDNSNAQKINEAIRNKKNIIPVGTTSLRTLESAYKEGSILEGFGKTNLYIYPPYDFKIASGLFTNFHTPKSSLLVLVSSMVGVDKLFEIYKYAIQKKYRFFSYGDAMLII
ncbi:MAG: tRNA preQ1(34) S-adenosylmethionine ribosyltransferase-isomerase QueA [Spirochaetes bacterium GWC1_27_15]|nr:MAG: tRNA preQ1(34) S-adenosylmethionine ribosyltransferase-isomerase QueA [Spirochaetes bacterium GWC1_27_15]